MPDPLDPALDPALATQTRRWHVGLFIAATLLSLPGAGVMLAAVHVLGTLPASALSADEWAYFLSALVVTLAGVAAWIALGLLFLRPACPRRHLLTWNLTTVFGMLAIPASIFWLVGGRAGTDPWLQAILWTVLASGSAALAAGVKFRLLALQSRLIRA
jgi:hypothetical protein